MRNKRSKRLVLVLALVCFALTLSAGAYMFDTGVSVGGEWYWSPWFGYFYNLKGISIDAYWLYHTEHTVMYITGHEDTGLWIYDPDYDIWLYTKRGLYPYMYSSDAREWIWYQRGSKSPRWFVSLYDGEWSALY